MLESSVRSESESVSLSLREKRRSPQFQLLYSNIENHEQVFCACSLTSVPGAVCGCLASSPRQLDTSTKWPGRWRWGPRGRQKSEVSRLDRPPSVECTLDWYSRRSCKRRDTVRELKLKSFTSLGVSLEPDVYSGNPSNVFSRKVKILIWRQLIADQRQTLCCKVTHVMLHYGLTVLNLMKAKGIPRFDEGFGH